MSCRRQRRIAETDEEETGKDRHSNGHVMIKMFPLADLRTFCHYTLHCHHLDVDDRNANPLAPHPERATEVDVDSDLAQT